MTVTESEIQLVTSDSATVSNLLDRTRIDQLPQNGRNLLGLLAATTPGLEAGGAGNSTQAQLPDPDSVQEVKIETLNSSAQFGGERATRTLHPVPD